MFYRFLTGLVSEVREVLLRLDQIDPRIRY